MEKVLDTLTNITNQIGDILARIWSNSFIRALVYLLIAFVLAGLASFLAKKFCKLLKIDAKLDKWGVNEGQVGTSISFIGKLVFLIVFLLILPASLDALGLKGVSAPITNFANICISYLPNIIAAIIIFFVGLFLGQILGQIVTVLLAKTKVDSLTQKFNNGKETNLRVSVIIGKIVFVVVLLIAIIQAVTVLGITAISAPALAIINTVFNAIPNILLAAVVVSIGILVANLVCYLLANVLTGVNFDGLVAKIIPQTEGKFSATKVVVILVRVIIILFVAAQGIEVLGLAVLSNIAAAVIAYLPSVFKALLIALAAYFGAHYLGLFLNKAMPKAKNAATIAKVAVYTIAAFMILSELNFATAIVNTAFVLIMVALALAFALAFGLGGKDFAKKTLDKVPMDKKDDEEENK